MAKQLSMLTTLAASPRIGSHLPLSRSLMSWMEFRRFRKGVEEFSRLSALMLSKIVTTLTTETVGTCVLWNLCESRKWRGDGDRGDAKYARA